MQHTPKTYVLTMHSPSRKALRLWTGRNIHTLRHCSAKEISHVLMEMRQQVENLQTVAPRLAAAGRSYSLNRSR